MSKILFFEGDVNNAISGLRKELVIELLKQHEIILIGSNINNDNINLPTKIFSKIYNLGFLKSSKYHFFLYLVKVAKIILTEKPTICISFNVRPNIVLGIIKYLIYYKCIATVTGTSTFLKESSFLKNFLLNLCFRKFDCIFFQNINDKKLFDLFGIKQNDYQLVNGSGIDTEYYNYPRIYNEKKSKSFILIARLLIEKGIIEYINAAKILKTKNYDVTFKLLGPFYYSGTKKNSIQKFEIECAIQNNYIEYLGETKNVIPFILNADCVVLPSYNEGMSNILLEAASLRTPIITTNVPGCYEIVDDNITGLLCKPKCAIDLANKMEIFLNLNKDKHILMGELARKKMVKEFNKNLIVDKYIKYINKNFN